MSRGGSNWGAERPAALVDVTGLSSVIEESEDGGLLIGAAAKNTAVAEHRAVRLRYPMLARAILAGASAQIRNMATVGGNILQRTRCTYFYDGDGSRCNKLSPGQGCDAIDGFNRNHAILGASSACVATHPSDMCVALAALNATIHLQGAGDPRAVPCTEFHRLPGDRPGIETVDDPARRESYGSILARARRDEVVAEAGAPLPEETQHWSMHSDGRDVLRGAGQCDDWRGSCEPLSRLVRLQAHLQRKDGHEPVPRRHHHGPRPCADGGDAVR